MNPQPDIPLLDLRPFCRESKYCETIILVSETGSANFKPWVKLGQVQVCAERNPSEGHRIQAYLGGATDFEHDSARIFNIQVVGLTFTEVSYQQAEFFGWIHPSNPEDFQVPKPDHDPYKGATICRRCKPRHKIVEEYYPKPNYELYRRLRGMRVQILVGPVLPKD